MNRKNILQLPYENLSVAPKQICMINGISCKTDDFLY